MRQPVWVSIAVCVFIIKPASAGEWSYVLEPYLLAASIEGDAGVGRVTGVPVDVGFSTILESLDIGAMIHFEAHNESGWGYVIDYGFMDLSDDLSGPRDGVLSARVRQGTFEGLVTRKSSGGAGNLEYFAGFRWWDNDFDVEIDPAVLPGTAETKIDASWIDILVGARLTHEINDKWTTQFRVDVGGFGVESDFTSAMSAAAIYRFSEKYALDIQYKALWVDYEDGSSGQPGFFQYDTVTHGPILGFRIDF